MSFSFRDRPRLSERLRGKSGDEILNEIKEQFDQDRKMFFDTAPSFGSTPMTGPFSRVSRTHICNIHICLSVLLFLHIGEGEEFYFANSGLYPRYVELDIGGENALIINFLRMKLRQVH